MARVLLVEDDPGQLAVRRLILERKGHQVCCAQDRESALECCARGEYDAVVMDLRLPSSKEGLRLIRQLKVKAKGARVIVLSGWPEDLEEAPEASLVHKVIRKPAGSQKLLDALLRLAMLALVWAWSGAAWAQTREVAFQAAARGEAVATLDLRAPDCDWGRAGREGAQIALRLDGGAPHQLAVFSGAEYFAQRAFLGAVEAGAHRLQVESAGGACAWEARGLQVEVVAPGDARYLPLAHAPVVHARANTIGKSTDVPLVAYYTEARDGADRVLEYTVVFSNEDGGTSTRDLMARWGRAADIEYVYRVWLNPDGSPRRAVVQTKNHKDLEYTAERLGFHPLLTVITDNNMLEPGAATSVRYQLAPEPADLSPASRELVLDAHPLLYAVVAKELAREGKLRAPGTVDGEKIADPRHYLVVEMKLSQERGAVQALVKLRASSRWLGSAVGLIDNYIPRDGWARVAIEVPPGTRGADLERLGVQCLIPRDPKDRFAPKTGRCRVEAIGRVFLPRADYAPGENLYRVQAPAGGWTLAGGELLDLSVP